MNNDRNILLSKIITNATDTTWSQAYTTLNFYIALSIKNPHEKEQEEPIAVFGKEVLEKIQREFFALDEKTLDSVKRAVENVTEKIEKEYSYSIVLATIVKDMLYIIVGSEGRTIIKRGEKVGTIATGEKDKITAFSGMLKPDDVVILETESFAKKIPLEKLSSLIDNLGVSEISENLAPLIHDSSDGTEAAIVLEFKSESPQVKTEEEIVEKKDEEEKEDEKVEQDEEKEDENIPVQEKNEAKSKNESDSVFANNPIPTKSKKILGKRNVIILGIIILLVVLGTSIFFEASRQETKKREALFTEKVVPLQKKFDEAKELVSLNRSLGLESLSEIKNSLNDIKTSFPKGSDEEKKLTALLDEVTGKIEDLEKASALQNQKIFFDGSKEEIKSVGLVTIRGGEVIGVNKETGDIVLLSNSGKSEKTIVSKLKDVTSITADETTIYLLSSDSISTVDKKTEKKTTAVSDISSSEIPAIDTFSSNIYALSAKDGSVDKYTSGSSNKKAYFTEDIKLSKPLSFSIDSSIWVLEESGKIRKFTKGKEDNFTIKGLSKSLSDNALIYTDQDYSNIYILDAQNARLVQIAKSGEFKNQYASNDFLKASSFAVDEKNKKVFYVLESKIYSFDLQ